MQRSLTRTHEKYFKCLRLRIINEVIKDFQNNENFHVKSSNYNAPVIIKNFQKK